jgi:multidrug efflux pump subunit AcrA (membrane-fusion protein)
MNKNRGLTPLAVVLMLSGSLALTGCDDKQAQQGAQQAPEVGVVTLKSEPLQITTELPGRTNAYRIAEVRPQVSGIILKRNFTEGGDVKPVSLCIRLIQQPIRPLMKARKAIWRKHKPRPKSADAEPLSKTARYQVHQSTGLRYRPGRCPAG